MDKANYGIQQTRAFNRFPKPYRHLSVILKIQREYNTIFSVGQGGLINLIEYIVCNKRSL